MPAGLQVWDSNGVLVVDTSTLLPRAINIGQITSDGSAYIPALASSTVVAVPVMTEQQGVKPEVTIDSGGTVRWYKKSADTRDYNVGLRVMLL